MYTKPQMKVKRSIMTVSKQLSYSHIDWLIDCLIQSVHKLSHQHTVIVVVIVFIHVMKDLVASSDMHPTVAMKHVKKCKRS